jgi:hypothetical protein
MAKIFEDNHATFNNTISPRIACDITDVYIEKGINFISNFPINTGNINEIKAIADREYNTKSVAKLMKEVIFLIYSVKNSKDHKLLALYALKKLSELKIKDEILSTMLETKNTIEQQIEAKPYSDNYLNSIDQLFKQIQND